MENASKALIIAGAILIAILLITVGVAIINSTSNVTGRVGDRSDAIEKETFNSQFTIYEGQDISASQIRSLMSKVNASNSTNEEDVTVMYGGTTQNTASFVTTNKKYDVSITTYDNGYVSVITVTDATTDAT